MKLVSPAFTCGTALPALYTRSDANLSPPLAWSDLPAGTASLALICFDPDAAHTWYHWVLWNIPPEWPGLTARFPRLDEFQGARQGKTSYRSLGYDGPEPPPGETHRYLFRLYALNARLNLATGIPAPQLERAMQGKILAKAGLNSTFTAPAREAWAW